MAFTRSPLTGTPATYTGTDDPDQLILLDQASDIEIFGLGDDDLIEVSALGLSANSLNNFKVYGGDADDTLSVTAIQLSNSTIQGGSGDDFVFAGGIFGVPVVGVVNNTVVRGGADNDFVVMAADAVGSTVNGNLGTDTVSVSASTLFATEIYGGSETDFIGVFVNGRATGLVVSGDKGADVMTVTGNIGNASVLGGVGNDAILVDADDDGFTADGGDGNDIMQGNGGGDGTYIGGEGNDSLDLDTLVTQGDYDIDMGVGADRLLAGGGTDTITQSRGDSVAATDATINATLAGSTVTFGNGVDEIAEFLSGTDDIDIGFEALDFTTLGDVNTVTTTLDVNEIYEISGSLAGNTFTADGAGTAFLYVIGGGNQALGTALADSSNIIITNTDLAAGDFSA